MLGLNDIIATLAAAIEFDGINKTAIDSYNLLPVLNGVEKTIREEIVVQSGGVGVYGIVQGKWKYIGVGNYEPQATGDPDGELYDLSVDESETTNLFDTYPVVAR